MKFGKPPYYSGISPTPILVMDRYLPPYPVGGLQDMLQFIGIENGWILDPIGNQPLSAIELAQAGYKVLVTCNNPIVGRIMQIVFCNTISTLDREPRPAAGEIRRITATG